MSKDVIPQNEAEFPNHGQVAHRENCGLIAEARPAANDANRSPDRGSDA
jgi:hypothetical protein